MLHSFLGLILASCLTVPMPDLDLQPLGKATYKKAIFKLYDASLCTAEDQFDLESETPFALALDYRMKFSSEQISGAGIHEMARFARKDKTEFAELEPLFRKCFPDVDKGDQIIAVSEGSSKAKFYYNGEMSCAVDYPKFRNLFFGIWLGEETRAPRKARLLKGLAE